ncbi:hypothetical protein FB451DRAFT_1162582 [Mycena latifolia]|nr:hypothetical protein FB451DRAFT_1162582 [Mycena latifolia]
MRGVEQLAQPGGKHSTTRTVAGSIKEKGSENHDMARRNASKPYILMSSPGSWRAWRLEQMMLLLPLYIVGHGDGKWQRRRAVGWLGKEARNHVRLLGLQHGRRMNGRAGRTGGAGNRNDGLRCMGGTSRTRHRRVNSDGRRRVNLDGRRGVTADGRRRPGRVLPRRGGMARAWKQGAVHERGGWGLKRVQVRRTKGKLELEGREWVNGEGMGYWGLPVEGGWGVQDRRRMGCGRDRRQQGRWHGGDQGIRASWGRDERGKHWRREPGKDGGQEHGKDGGREIQQGPGELPGPEWGWDETAQGASDRRVKEGGRRVHTLSSVEAGGKSDVMGCERGDGEGKMVRTSKEAGRALDLEGAIADGQDGRQPGGVVNVAAVRGGLDSMRRIKAFAIVDGAWSVQGRAEKVAPDPGREDGISRGAVVDTCAGDTHMKQWEEIDLERPLELSRVDSASLRTPPPPAVGIWDSGDVVSLDGGELVLVGWCVIMPARLEWGDGRAASLDIQGDGAHNGGLDGRSGVAGGLLRTRARDVNINVRATRLINGGMAKPRTGTDAHRGFVPGPVRLGKGGCWNRVEHESKGTYTPGWMQERRAKRRGPGWTSELDMAGKERGRESGVKERWLRMMVVADEDGFWMRQGPAAPRAEGGLKLALYRSRRCGAELGRIRTNCPPAELCAEVLIKPTDGRPDRARIAEQSCEAMRITAHTWLPINAQPCAALRITDQVGACIRSHAHSAQACSRTRNVYAEPQPTYAQQQPVRSPTREVPQLKRVFGFGGGGKTTLSRESSRSRGVNVLSEGWAQRHSALRRIASRHRASPPTLSTQQTTIFAPANRGRRFPART